MSFKIGDRVKLINFGFEDLEAIRRLWPELLEKTSFLVLSVSSYDHNFIKIDVSFPNAASFYREYGYNASWFELYRLSCRRKTVKFKLP